MTASSKYDLKKSNCLLEKSLKSQNCPMRWKGLDEGGTQLKHSGLTYHTCVFGYQLAPSHLRYYHFGFEPERCEFLS